MIGSCQPDHAQRVPQHEQHEKNHKQGVNTVSIGLKPVNQEVDQSRDGRGTQVNCRIVGFGKAKGEYKKGEIEADEELKKFKEQKD